MRTVLRIVNLPKRLTSVHQPVDLRYLDKDDQGHTRICVRTAHRKTQDETVPSPSQRSAPSRTQG